MQSTDRDRKPDAKLAREIKKLEQRRAKLDQQINRIARCHYRADLAVPRALRIARLVGERATVDLRLVQIRFL